MIEKHMDYVVAILNAHVRKIKQIVMILGLSISFWLVKVEVGSMVLSTWSGLKHRHCKKIINSYKKYPEG